MTLDLPGTAIEDATSEGGPHTTYQSLLDRDVLAFQACAACAHAVFPPRGRCSHCGADALTWRSSAGTGTVYSSTVLAPRDKPAYAVVLVDLDEGYRMMSRIVSDHDAASIAIDDRVAVRFEPSADVVLPMFAPAGGDR